VSSSYGDKSSSSNSSSSGCSSNNNTAATAAASASNWRHLQNDPDFVFACLELCPFALAHAGPVPRANEACVLAAVTNYINTREGDNRDRSDDICTWLGCS